MKSFSSKSKHGPTNRSTGDADGPSSLSSVAAARPSTSVHASVAAASEDCDQHGIEGLALEPWPPADGRSPRHSAVAAVAADATALASQRERGSPSVDAGSVKSQRSLRSRAIAYLSRREHSRGELIRKLAPFAHSDAESDQPDEPREIVERLLDALEKEGWLSDQRFAESVLNRRAGRFGSQRILSELRRGEIDEHLVRETAERLATSEHARALNVWRKKFGDTGAAKSPSERAKQMRFLMARGFPSVVIAKVLRSQGVDDTAIDEALDAAPDD